MRRLVGDLADERIDFPRDLAPRLHATLSALETKPEHRARAALVRPLPSVEDTARLLDVGYIASLLEEEGRPVLCGFAYLSPEGAAELGFSVFRFAEALPFRPGTLAKLAPAVQVGRSEFGVFSYEGELCVWGLIHHGDQTFAIDSERTATYFAAVILRAGTFTVHFDERLQLLFSRDHGHCFDQDLDLLGTMRDRARLEPSTALALCRLARRMLQHGHGGTILVARADAALNGVVFHPAMTPATSPDRLLASAVEMDEQAKNGGEFAVEGISAGQRLRQRIALEQAHDEALDFVANLTAIDGAVILDTALGLLGAGAMIQMPDSAMPAEVVTEDPRVPGTERPIALPLLGGNRHRSAVCFCAQNAFALALVASQDGDLSFIARRDDGFVHVLKPYELGVGI